jgi:glutamyl-Q tRNA(Asp) synthetase
LPRGRRARSERLRVNRIRIEFHDFIQGPIHQQLDAAVGDFVLRRADGVHAYQLAVVVDDAAAAITHIVRGADLLASTPRQIWLQRLLGFPSPAYGHVPVALGPDGRKLSKSLAARPVDTADPIPCLLAAWQFLGQPIPARRPGCVDDFWRQAIPAWSCSRVAPQHGQPALAA